MSDLVGNPKTGFLASRLILPFFQNSTGTPHSFMTNELSHCYHLGDPTVIFRGVMGDFESLFYFSMKFL